MAAILVVDDDPLVRDFLAALLTSQGHRPVQAAGGAEALELVRLAPPDLVITDVLMPGMDGFELVRQLRHDPAAAGMPVVFHTSYYHQQEAVDLARACGVQHVIHKPARLEAILTTVNAALAGRARPAATLPRETFDRDHLRLLTDQLAAKVKELETVNWTLEKHRHRLQAIFDNVQEAILLVDDDARVVDVNPAACKLLGGRRAELLGRSVWSMASQPHRETAADVWFALLGAGRQGGESTLLRPDGSRVAVEYLAVTNIEPGIHLGVLRDVTERRRAEQELRASEERFRTLNAAAPIGIFQTDAEGCSIYTNERLQTLCGLTADEMHGYGWSQVVHPDDRAALLARWSEQARTGAEFADEHRLLTTAGQTRWVHVRAKPMFTPHGQPAGHVGTVADITERKESEQKLRDYSERLQSLSHRLLEVQETERRFLARELHDEIGQLLTGLQLSLEISTREPPAAFPARLDQVRTQVQELLNRVREMALDLRPTMLDDLGLLPTLHWFCRHYTARTGVRVVLQHGTEDRRFPPELETTVYRLVQESLTNVARHAGVAEATVRLWADPETLHVQIQDHGAGFDPEAARAAGVSSGLTGMRERASWLGGQLLIESARGSGTRVTAALPLGTACSPGGEDRPA